MELYRKYRPTSFKQVIGQDSALKTLKGFGRKNLPHVILFTGPSGVGKTTIARILRKAVKCSDLDFQELNCASERGIDMVRDIRNRMSLAPSGGESRVWLIDECQKLTSDAQSAFLKILEDTPSHVYFFLATTDPQKLLNTIKTRCTEIKLDLVDGKCLGLIVEKVATEENILLGDEVLNKIISVADGSPRKALVILNQIAGIDGTVEQLAAIEIGDSELKGIEIARALMQNVKVTWPEISTILKSVKEEPESIRWIVIGYAKTMMLVGGKKGEKAYQVYCAFRDNFYDSKTAGLVGACWEVVHN